MSHSEPAQYPALMTGIQVLRYMLQVRQYPGISGVTDCPSKTHRFIKIPPFLFENGQKIKTEQFNVVLRTKITADIQRMTYNTTDMPHNHGYVCCNSQQYWIYREGGVPN